ncbi:MAG: hypothetical protein IJ901_01580 [Bacteroidaceae bacterium]|nr:hypothetical protein [Bacteroidaceae bacterium]
MNIRKYIFTLFILLSTTISAQKNVGVSNSQDDIQIYRQAVEAYEFGHFEKADSIL